MEKYKKEKMNKIMNLHMKKNLSYAALAIMALVSCTSNDYVGDQKALENTETNRSISFGFDVPRPTRATGSDAATALDNQFIVYGEKSETADGAAPVTDGSTTHQLVFKNYVLKYIDNSAYTTTSNTKGWEYVGLTPTYGDNVTPQAGETQTIKYWDYSATNYVFTAVSALESQLASGDVKVTKITSKTDGNKVYDKGYTVVLTASADPTKLYFSDRQVISQGSGTNRDAVNAYGGNVTFTFRNATSQIRVGMYETIPGYGVKIKKFYYVNDAAPTFATMTTEATSNFTANVPNLLTSSAATLDVTYYNEGTRQNQPKISVDGTSANYITLTGSGLAADVTLATSANAPTYDNSGNFTTVFPQESNDKSLKLKVDYQLFNSTTGETINVTGATAEVPAKYLQWLPNYKYTYLFKISDNTNGSTGQDVAGLYPITFDAIEIAADDGKVEYITTVSEPTITTFGAVYNGTKYTSYQTGQNEYLAQTSPNQLDIFATFTEVSTVKTPTVDGTSGAQHVNVFKVTATDASLITEASVAEAIANPAMTVDIYTRTGAGTTESPYKYTKVTDATTITAGTTYYKADGSSNVPGTTGYSETTAVAGTDYKVGAKINVTNITSDDSANFTAAPAKVDEVPSEDGRTKTIAALKLTGVKAGTYAIEYEASAAWTGTYKKVYKVIVVQ